MRTRGQVSRQLSGCLWCASAPLGLDWQPSHDTGTSASDKPPLGTVKPASGLAKDYLQRALAYSVYEFAQARSAGPAAWTPDASCAVVTPPSPPPPVGVSVSATTSANGAIGTNLTINLKQEVHETKVNFPVVPVAAGVRYVLN